MPLTQPFATEVDFASGVLSNPHHTYQRRLSDMPGYYHDRAAVERILAKEGDRLIYEVQGIVLPEVEGQLPHCTTRILPGRIGAEFHMTKGHFHARREQGEVYFGLSGQGMLLLQTERRADQRTAHARRDSRLCAAVLGAPHGQYRRRRFRVLQRVDSRSRA